MTIALQTVNLDEVRKGSYYTIVGAGGEPQEWIDGYSKMLQDAEIGIPSKWVVFKGREVNRHFGITADPFPNDLTFLAFSLDGLNVAKLAMFKLQQGDRWFDDIIDNTLRLQEEEEEVGCEYCGDLYCEGECQEDEDWD